MRSVITESSPFLYKKKNVITASTSCGGSDSILSNLNSETNPEVRDFYLKYSNISGKKIVLKTNSNIKIDTITEANYQTIINLEAINGFRRINKYIKSLNKKMPIGGTFISCFEPKENRKDRIINHYIKPLGFFIYIIDSFVHRVLPKLLWSKKLYFYFTKGRYRTLSKAETFGRLYSCGFEIIDHKIIAGFYYFIAKKNNNPIDNIAPSYGPLIRLERVGKNGKPIRVYKIRTMHPYSEFLQAYIYSRNKLKNGGKINNDFRISRMGRILRKYWIDELPMLFNWMKGDMKLIGVRPLSTHYLNLYPEKFRNERIQFKPGLIPPFYADMPRTLEEIIASEKKYLDLYKRKPLIADLYYAFQIFNNIIFKGERSG